MTLGRRGRASPRLRIRKRRTRDTALRRPRSRLLPRNACPQDAKCAARRLHVSDRSTGIRSEGVRKKSFSTRKETLELRRDRRARLEEITMGALQDLHVLIREWHGRLRALQSEPRYWVGKSSTSRD